MRTIENKGGEEKEEEKEEKEEKEEDEKKAWELFNESKCVYTTKMISFNYASRVHSVCIHFWEHKDV